MKTETDDMEAAMITQDMIDRINQLAKKKKTVGLTDAETEEQKKLYREYLEGFKANFRSELDMITFVDDDNAGGEKNS